MKDVKNLKKSLEEKLLAKAIDAFEYLMSASGMLTETKSDILALSINVSSVAKSIVSLAKAYKVHNERIAEIEATQKKIIELLKGKPAEYAPATKTKEVPNKPNLRWQNFGHSSKLTGNLPLDFSSQSLVSSSLRGKSLLFLTNCQTSRKRTRKRSRRSMRHVKKSEKLTSRTSESSTKR